MGSPKLGKGALLKIGDGASPEVFTTIGKMSTIGGTPGGTRDLIDITNHDSSGDWREKINGLIEGKEISCTAIYLGDQTQQNAVQTAFENGTTKNWKLEIPTTTPKTISFAALVTAFDVLTPIDDKMMMQFTLKSTGAPTWA